MELSQYLVALARDGARFAEVVPGHLGVPVPSCPGWTVGDLTYHLGEVHHFWRNIVEHRHADPNVVGMPSRPDDDHLVDWFRRELAQLERALATADPNAKHWTWSAQQDTAFVIRRMAQETSVHLWDALDALGQREPLEAWLAGDGVEEFVVHFAPFRKKDAPAVSGRIEFVVAESGRVVRTDGMGEVDAVVTAPAGALLLALWGRTPIDPLWVDGDLGVVTRFVEGTGLD